MIGSSWAWHNAPQSGETLRARAADALIEVIRGRDGAELESVVLGALMMVRHQQSRIRLLGLADERSLSSQVRARVRRVGNSLVR